LLRSFGHAALGVLSPEDGAPLVSRIGLAVTPDGVPVTLVSDLAAHTPALAADPRCSLMVGEPGKGDPLAHPRVMLRCRAEAVPRADEAAVRGAYLERHPKATLYVDFADFRFLRLMPEGGTFNAGFGRAYRLTASDLIG
jgi:putative heme iron utilization protein